MSMPLETDVTLDEIRSEEQRFDYLDGVRELVSWAKEFHADEGNDSEYCYLFWVPQDDEHAFVTRVRSNMDGMDPLDRGGWNFDLNWNGTGLVFVRAFL